MFGFENDHLWNFKDDDGNEYNTCRDPMGGPLDMDVVAYVSIGTNPAKLMQNAPLRIKAGYGKAAEEVVYKMTYMLVS